MAGLPRIASDAIRGFPLFCAPSREFAALLDATERPKTFRRPGARCAGGWGRTSGRARGTEYRQCTTESCPVSRTFPNR